MQPLLRFFLIFSVVLMKGFSAPTPPVPLKCEVCVAEAETCSGEKESCPSGVDSCFTLSLEIKNGDEATKLHGSKGCMPKAKCIKIKGEIGNPMPDEYGSYPAGSIVKKVGCTDVTGSEVSETSPSSPDSSPSFSGPPTSFLLSLFGFLLMNVIF